MKDEDLKENLEAVHQNALEVKKALDDEFLKDYKYDGLVSLIIVDENDTWLIGKLSHIEIDDGTISLSNFRCKPDSIISQAELHRRLAKIMEDLEENDIKLFDISIELYNENGQLYASSHLTKVNRELRDPLNRLELSNQTNKNLKI